MAEAIFGLVGVIVGALAQGGWAWWMERRRASWAARKAARLFAPCLTRCGIFLLQAGEGATWGEVVTVIDSNLAQWPAHSEVLAGTLSNETWHEIHKCVRPLEQLASHASQRPAARELNEEACTWAKELHEIAFSGAAVCHAIGWRGAQRSPVRSALVSLRYRFRPLDDETLMRDVLGDDHEPDPTTEARVDNSR